MREVLERRGKLGLAILVALLPRFLSWRKMRHDMRGDTAYYWGSCAWEL